jgi:hypothetical protein
MSVLCIVEEQRPSSGPLVPITHPVHFHLIRRFRPLEALERQPNTEQARPRPIVFQNSTIPKLATIINETPNGTQEGLAFGDLGLMD